MGFPAWSPSHTLLSLWEAEDAGGGAQKGHPLPPTAPCRSCPLASQQLARFTMMMISEGT